MTIPRDQLKRRFSAATGLIFVIAAITWPLACNRFFPSLEKRIQATAKRVREFPADSKIPEFYEQEVIALAKEPTANLRNAFHNLDSARRDDPRNHPPNDGVWLTGTLITILAFDCPPVTSRDKVMLYELKSRLTPDTKGFAQAPADDQMLAEYPWSRDHGSWHLHKFSANYWGSSDGEIAPRFEYYASHFKRRPLP